MAILLQKGGRTKRKDQKTTDYRKDKKAQDKAENTKTSLQDLSYQDAVKLRDEGYSMEYDDMGNYSLWNRGTGEKYRGPIITGMGTGEGGFFTKDRKEKGVAKDLFQKLYSEGFWGNTRAQQVEIDKAAAEEEKMRLARGQAIREDSDAAALTAENKEQLEKSAEAITNTPYETHTDLNPSYWDKSDKLVEREAKDFEKQLEEMVEEGEEEEGVPDIFQRDDAGNVWLTDEGMKQREVDIKKKYEYNAGLDLKAPNQEIADFQKVNSLGENFAQGLIPWEFEEGSIGDYVQTAAKWHPFTTGIPRAVKSLLQTAWNLPDNYGMTWGEYVGSDVEERKLGAAEYKRRLDARNKYQEYKKSIIAARKDNKRRDK